MSKNLQNEEKKISRYDFYFETSLYESIKIDNFNEDILNGEVDAYNPNNHIETTYTIHESRGLEVVNGGIYESSGFHSPFTGFLQISLRCKRKDDDVLFFVVYIDELTITKIGQLPSLADIQFAELGKKYDKVLPKEDLKNLKKAIGLHAHGAGAGSFVYLRRIFENLIFETFNEHKGVLKITETQFNEKRMMEKVDELKAFLPEQLLEMKRIYAILSTGVHELDETDCLKFFGPIKMSIELILDQKIELRKKKERDDEAKKAIASILSEM